MSPPLPLQSKPPDICLQPPRWRWPLFDVATTLAALGTGLWLHSLIPLLLASLMALCMMGLHLRAQTRLLGAEPLQLKRLINALAIDRAADYRGDNGSVADALTAMARAWHERECACVHCMRRMRKSAPRWMPRAPA